MKTKAGNREKSDVLINTGLITFLLVLILRIPLTSIIGANGIGYFSSVNEVFLLVALFIGGGLAETLQSTMRFKLKREQFKGAQLLFRCAVILAAGFGMAVGLLMVLLSRFVAETFFLERFARPSIWLMAPAALFITLTELLRGYFQGTGSVVPTLHSLFLTRILILICGSLMASLMYNYGERVAAVLHDPNYAAVYGAMGVFAGVLLASFLSFLHLMLICLLYQGTLKKQLYRDNTRSVESAGYLYRSLLIAALPEGGAAVIFMINPLIDQRIYYYYMNVLSRGDVSVGANKAGTWGDYYGIVLVMIGIFAVCGCLVAGKGIKGVTAAWFRDEQRMSRDLLTQLLNRCLVTAIPLAVLLAVLAGPLSTLCRGDEAKTAELIVLGSVLVIFITFTYVWAGLLRQLRKVNLLLLVGAGGLAVHLLTAFLILFRLKDAAAVINGVMVSNLISGAVIFAGGFYLSVRLFNYRFEWLKRCARALVTSLLCSGAAGLIVVLLKLAIMKLIGEAATVIICLLVAIPVYIILLIILRGLSEGELSRLPGGVYMIRLAKMMHFM